MIKSLTRSNLFYLAGGCLNILTMRQSIKMSNMMKIIRMDMGFNAEADFLGAKQIVMVGIDAIKAYPVCRLCSLAGQS